MPVIKQKFGLKYEDIEKLNKKLLKINESKEKTINDCLKEIASPKVTRSVTSFLPVSEKGNRHAKKSKWYEVEYYNLSFVLSNSLKGKRGTSFYYLYYPATGTGTSNKKGPNDFLGKGIDKEYNNIVSDLLNALDKKIEEELR